MATQEESGSDKPTSTGLLSKAKRSNWGLFKLFSNPWSTWKEPGKLDTLKWYFTEEDNSAIPADEEVLNEKLPIMKPDFTPPPEDKISMTWIGHASVLVQFDGMNVLADPVFSERCSPVQMLGPKRFRPCPCTVNDLPEIHVVLISHNHYDHLDSTTVSNLNKRFGENLRWYVPLEMTSWMKSHGIKNVKELDWWGEDQPAKFPKFKVACVPAQHWSLRKELVRNTALWGGWVVQGPKHSFYFTGDSGYCEAFKEIGEKYGPFDLSAIPIGCYEPRWFMKFQHVNPEDAVKIHVESKSKQSVGVHWGTFTLANEHYLAPPIDLKKALKKFQVPPEQFITMKHGETRHFPGGPVTSQPQKESQL